MEREQAHTRHCRSCSGALRRLTVLHGGLGLVVVAGLALAALPLPLPARLTALALLLVAVALLLRAQSGRWISGLQRGRGRPPRNRIERRPQRRP